MIDQQSIINQTIQLSINTDMGQILSNKKIQDQGSKWKSKSLNSMPLEDYSIDLPNINYSKTQINKKSNNKNQYQGNKNGQQIKQLNSRSILPKQPKIKKINQKMFCITLGNEINIFHHLDNSEKARMKPPKRNFKNQKYVVNQNIQFVSVNGSNLIFVATKNQLYILQMQKRKSEDGYNIQLQGEKHVDNLKAVTFIGKQMVILSSDQVFQYKINTTFDLISKKTIQFETQDDKKMFKQLKPIGIVVQSLLNFNFFGTLNQMKQDYNSKRKLNLDQKPIMKACQILHLIKFKIQYNFQNVQNSNLKKQDSHLKNRQMAVTQMAQSKINSIHAKIYTIDHVFDTGIFNKSKIFKVNQNVFLMSLHQEIILIKYHFNKFIVWDNVSIVSSKSQQKKGQLILADKRVLVYSQNCQIYAHDIYFNQVESRINMPPIDSFKGNQKDGQILYDAVLLEYDQDSLMKVLFYFKQDYLDSGKQNIKKDKGANDPNKNQAKLQFSLLCISQSDPKQKLTQMLKAKKQPNQINQFCQRFNINSLQKTKCMWSVCDKTQKDIGNVLLQISDDNYIQTELDNILKEKPHGLSFLIQIQKKQITRFTKTIVNNLFNETGDIDKKQQQIRPYRMDEQQRKNKVKLAIQSLMQSIMFKKKLKYSTKFLSFKQYDFIEIGKLKAASLKQQIKLLSCKKYQQRLIYFLNTFRIQVIANYQQIFRFLLMNKNCEQIQQFIKNFSFILPNFVETSPSFLLKQNYNIHKAKKQNMQKQLFIFNEDKIRKVQNESKIKSDEDNSICKLWFDYSQNTKDDQKQLNTLQQFRMQILEAIRSAKKDKMIQDQAIYKFNQILDIVVNDDWFRSSAFKQHSMINKKSKQLQQQFLQLKTKKAYQILIKYLFQQIQRGNKDINEQGVDRMLQRFVRQGLIPMSFKKNDDAKLQVYRILKRRQIPLQGKFSKKSSYLVLNQAQYFSFLFKQVRQLILTQIKRQYTIDDTDFFRQRFQIYLKSKQVNLRQIIVFLDQFHKKDDQDDKQDIRQDVFNCIIRLLKLGDKQNAQRFIKKILDDQVFPDKKDLPQHNQTLRQQAKIPYGFVFYNFFKAFKLDYTYQQLTLATKNSNLSSNEFLKSIIKKYCQGEYQIQHQVFYQNQVRTNCLIVFQNQRISGDKVHSVDIYNRPLQFYGILLYLIDLLDFQVQGISLYHQIIQNYLNQGKNDLIKKFQSGPPKIAYLSSQDLLASNYPLNQSGKFDQLFNFVKNIQNYDLHQGKNSGQKNYQLISDFKSIYDTQQIFVDYTVDWIARNYSAIKSQQQIQLTFATIKKVIQILQKSKKSSRKIKQVNAFHGLLQLLKMFNPELMKKIDFIKQQMKYSGFIFMMHMFKQIGIQNFIKCKIQGSDKIDNKQQQQQYESQKKLNSSRQTQFKIFNLMSIFSQFKTVKGEDNLDQRQNPQFIRFIVQLCDIMIRQQQYEIAWDLMIRSVNQNTYFRDIFYYLTSNMIIQNHQQFKKQFKVLLSTETPKNIKIKLTAMIKGNKQSGYNYRVLSFPQKYKQQIINDMSKVTLRDNRDKQNKKDSQFVQNILKRQKQTFMKLKINAIFIFEQLLQSNRPDEAFYFLVRIKKIPHDEIKQIVNESKRLGHKLYRYSYMLLTSYMKCLYKYISTQFYPTFVFFKSKYEILIDRTQRMDIIKDINIAVSRLKSKLEQEQHQFNKKQLSQSKQQLYTYYIKYMEVWKQNPIIKLTQDDQLQATKRIKSYVNNMVPLKLQQQQKMEIQAKIKIAENQQKIQKVHQNNKLNVIHKQISQTVGQAKRAADKYAAILQQKRKSQKKLTYAQKKQQQLFEIKRKQQQDINSIKDSYKSNTTQKVQQLLQNLKKKRQIINQNRMRSSAIRDQIPININVPSKDNNINTNKLDDSNKYNIQISNPKQKSYLRNDNKPTSSYLDNQIQITKKQKFNFQQLRTNDKFSDIQNKIRRLDQSIVSKAKITIQQMNELFKSKQPEALKYLQKFDMIKQNMQVGVQLVKRVYSIIKDLSVFLQFLRYLIGYDQRYKTVLQQKSIGIVSQMIKMDQKINLKQLIPVQLFTSVQNMTLKDYYNCVYQLMRPNIKKMLGHPDIAPHGIGILIRFSLGSQTKYYHRVFSDYINALLKNYQLKVSDQKQIMLLAQKLRSQFTNLDPQGRQFLFQKLINQISNQYKRKKIIQALKKTAQRKADSSINGQQIQQFNRALLRADK